MIIIIFLSFIVGVLTKLVDLAEEHGLKMNKDLKLILSSVYGLLLGYLISIIPLPGFWMGILIGLLLSGKIDAESHYTGFAFILISLTLFGFPPINPVIVIISSLLCSLEEWINDELVDKKRVKGWFNKVLKYRPLLELTSAILAIIYSNILIFLILFSFDTGYVFINKFMKDRLNRKSLH